MPTPNENESQKDFVKRCIPIVLNDGTAKDDKQAVAVCNSMWEKSMTKEAAEKEAIQETEIVPAYVPYGVISFEELDAVQEAQAAGQQLKSLAQQFQEMVNEILFRDDIEDKAAAITSLAGELTKRMSKKKELEVKQTEGLTMAKVKEMIAAVFTKKEKPQPDPQPTPGFHFFHNKEADQFQFLAVYSNNYRDDDNPPEIISKASHENFVRMVDNKEAALPELWLWHVPEWKWGQTTAVAYDKSGFALAIGTVDKGAEPLAEWIGTQDMLVSHGMPTHLIKRDPTDNSIITHHVTKEISPLPSWAAANKSTHFLIPKEEDMGDNKAISEYKREEFLKLGATPEMLDQVEQKNAEEKDKNDEAGLETKEAEKPTLDMADVVKSFAIVAEQVVAQGKILAELQDITKELTKTKEQQITEQVQELPEASLSAILAQQFSGVLQKGNAIDKAQADKDGKLKGPETADVKKGTPGLDTSFPELYGGVQ